MERTYINFKEAQISGKNIALVLQMCYNSKNCVLQDIRKIVSGGGRHNGIVENTMLFVYWILSALFATVIMLVLIFILDDILIIEDY